MLGLREKLVNPDAAWGDDASSAWAGKGFGSGGTSAWNAWPTTEPKDAWPSSRADDSGPTSIPQPEQEQHKPQEPTEHHLPPARPPPPSTTTTNMPSMATTGTVHEEEAQPPAPQDFPATQKDIWGSNTTSAVGWGVHTSTPHSSSTTTPTTTTSTIHPGIPPYTHPLSPTLTFFQCAFCVILFRRLLGIFCSLRFYTSKHKIMNQNKGIAFHTVFLKHN